jgi:hypothetical protein
VYLARGSQLAPRSSSAVGLVPPTRFSDAAYDPSTRASSNRVGTSLSDYRVGAAIAVPEMNRARGFYAGKLGSTAAGDHADGRRTYQCGERTTLHVFAPARARASGRWPVVTAFCRPSARLLERPHTIELSTPRAGVVSRSSLTRLRNQRQDWSSGPWGSQPRIGPEPNRVPKQGSARGLRKEENRAGMRDCGWRDPDSNRGHHDFQSWVEISLTAA